MRKSICFTLAGLLVTAPLWLLVDFEGNDALTSRRVALALGFCSLAGLIWLFNEMRVKPLRRRP